MDGTTSALDLLERIVETAEPVLVIDRDGRCTFANPSARELLDTADAMLVGLPIAGALPWLRGTPFEDAWAAAVEGGVPVRVEAALPGSERWLGAHFVPGVDDVVVHLRETTDRHLSEARADLQRGELEVAHIAGTTGAFLIDLATDTADLSERVRQIYGLGATDGARVPRERTRTLIHPDDLERVEAAIRRAVTDVGEVHDVTYRIRRADSGEERHVRAVGEVIRDADGSARTLVGSMTDVTAREEVESALRASEERLRRTVEGIDAIIVFQEDADAPVVMGPQVERLLGHPASRFTTYADWDRLIHTDDIEACLAAWRSPAHAWDIEYRFQRADGTYAWLGDRGRRIIHDDGRRPGLFGVIIDITARVEAREALRASEARYRAVTESAADAIVTIDASGAIVGWNGTAERMFGIAGHDIIGRSVSALVPPAVVDQHMLALARFRDGGPSRFIGRTVELQGRRGDGSVFPMELSLADWTMASGRFATAIIRDISERVRAEAVARESAAHTAQLVELQRSITDAMTEGVIALDADGRMTWANARATAILGLQVDELRGLTSFDPRWQATRVDGSPFPPEEHPSELTRRTGLPCRDVLMNLAHPDGRRVWIQINSEPRRDRDGHLTGVVASFSDVTAQRDMEVQLRQAQRLEAIGQLAGGVAHDFNNLLGAIRGYSELVQAALEPGSEARDDIAQVLLTADRAAALTRQLLAFSRRATLEPQVVDPAEVVANLLPMVRRLLGEHIEIATERSPASGEVFVDPGQLEQVIVNLAVNARDAMPDGGRLLIRIDGDTSTALSPDGTTAVPCVRIAVGDSGAGMDGPTLARIFEPFFTTKEAGKGTGMGLATVYGIVRQSRGRITAESTPGVGSTFTIELPRHTAAPAPVAGEREAPAAPKVTDGATETILLAEDDDALRALLSRLLSSAGYTVLVAASGTEAVELAAFVDEIDLLVTDVRMPGLQGPEVARRLRLVRPDLPVLFISAFATELGEAAHGDVVVLDKPFSAVAIAGAVRQALEEHRRA